MYCINIKCVAYCWNKHTSFIRAYILRKKQIFPSQQLRIISSTSSRGGISCLTPLFIWLKFAWVFCLLSYHHEFLFAKCPAVSRTHCLLVDIHCLWLIHLSILSLSMIPEQAELSSVSCFLLFGQLWVSVLIII